ncbi:hypothetical protein PR202_ga28961 [Eleusine coracana subsp. coracana]|uniref:DUF3615 domain-containing protein n=1 Tax=Eleusine coracana subsp. coracana TaxID=191504 RepID=A0AAV5DK70_ELECO|nr:hypothetical protein PR202_ga28961 [Eleusine coracana subsp. coracana]
MIPFIHHALDHYNARHPGGDFDIVKPLSEASVHFKAHLWWHLNFLARSRNSNKIKRFFAEVHYHPGSGSPYSVPTPIVELCTVLEEPLDQYKRSCAFCINQPDILHPVGDPTFVCGNQVQKARGGPLEFLRRGKPSQLGKLPGLRKLGMASGLPGPRTPSDPGMPPWMPSREEAIRDWDAIWASDEEAWATVLYMLPSSSQEME